MRSNEAIRRHHNTYRGKVLTTEQFSRTELLYGEEAIRFFAKQRIAVFGIGGVGGYVVEALARSGIGALDLIDNDKVALSNINRQIIATHKSLGRYKVDVAAERIRDIFPECEVRTYKTFFLPETADEFDFGVYDYVVDCIDTVSGKLAIIGKAKNASVPVISSMGAGNKLDPTAFEVADLYKTSVCPLAKVMRRECKKRGIDSLKVVYSKEMPRMPQGSAAKEDTAGESDSTENGDVSPEGGSRKRSIPGSVAFVPSVAGLIIAGEILNDLAARCLRKEE